MAAQQRLLPLALLRHVPAPRATLPVATLLLAAGLAFAAAPASANAVDSESRPAPAADGAASRADGGVASGVSAVTARSSLTFNASAAAFGVRNSQSVRNLQTQLIGMRFATAGLRRSGVTGAYLSKTRASVARVQRRLGFSGVGADGIVGPASAAHLGLAWVADLGSPLAPPTSPPATSRYPIDPPVPGAKVPALTATQLKGALQRAGFAEPGIRTAWALAMRESGGRPAIVGPANSNGTHDYGLFQINDVHRASTDFTRIYDPVFNAQVALRLSAGGQDFGAWGVGDTGWAGQLHKTAPALWKQLQDSMLAWRAKYPGP